MKNSVAKSGGFLGTLLGPLLKTGLPLKPLAKSVLILTAEQQQQMQLFISKCLDLACALRT